jgi:hypothetical protein
MRGKPMSREHVTLPREEVERVIKVLRYAAHPQRSPHADALEAALTASPQAAPEGEPPTRGVPRSTIGPALDEADAAFADWLAHEMPPGTIVSDARWWAPRILRAIRRLASPQVQGGEAVPTGWYLRTGHGDSIHFGPKPPACLMPEAWRPFYATPQRAPGVDSPIADIAVVNRVVAALERDAANSRGGLAYLQTAANIIRNLSALASGPSGVDGYYLACFNHGRPNGLIQWWMPNNAGYTPDLAQAGIYTDLTPGYHDSEDTVPVPVEFIYRLRVRRVVDVGDTLNGAFHSAKALRAALAVAAAQDQGEG